ncbi:MAG: hypothetical protein ABI402_11030, partial [Ferruginibacter sp.]
YFLFKKLQILPMKCFRHAAQQHKSVYICPVRIIRLPIIGVDKKLPNTYGVDTDHWIENVS